MRLPGRPPPPAFVMMGPITTFLRRCWSHHDVQVIVGQAFGLGVTSPTAGTSMIAATFHDFRTVCAWIAPVCPCGTNDMSVSGRRGDRGARRNGGAATRGGGDQGSGGAASTQWVP